MSDLPEKLELLYKGLVLEFGQQIADVNDFRRMTEAAKRIRELEAEKGRLIVLLSQWLATYDDDYQPDGDLIDDTLDVVEALEGQKKGPEGP